MRKPNNYDSTKTNSGFTPITAGGHHLVIKNVKEDKSKSGKDMIIVFFDMAPNDEQANYFRNEYEADTRADKKWPFKGRQYILLEDMNGNCNASYKAFITAVEDSNHFKVDWNADYKQFVGKRIGGVFGEAEYLKKDNSVGITVELRWFRDDSKVMEERIPNLKTLKNKPQPVQTTPDGFIDIPEGVTDDELPFD